jgi:type I restriction enzyme, S subunit
MKRYDTYKDSGVEWIGEIPSNWEKKKIKHHSDVNVGLVINPSTYFDDKGTVPIITGKNVQVTGIDLSKVDFITEESNEFLKKTQIYEGDLVSMRVGYPGRTCIVQQKEDGINCCSLIITRKSKTINSKLLEFQLNTNLGKIQVEVCQGGMGQQVVNLSDWNEFIVLTPPLSEQQQIVSFLDTKTSLIDSLIEKTQRKIELLKEKRTSLINEVVTKGLNPNVEMKDSGVEWIGEIPSGWEKSKFKFHSEIVTGNTPSKKKEEVYYTDNKDGLPWVKPTRLDQGFDFVFKSDQYLTDEGKSETRVIPKNSIMVCSIGNTLGKFGISGCEMSTNQQINSVICDENSLYHRFCMFFVSVLTEDLIKWTNFVTLPIFTKSDFEDTEIIIPPISEQQQIVEYLDEQTQLMDKTISIEGKRIELLNEYRQSLISEVVTGKLKVTTDE